MEKKLVCTYIVLVLFTSFAQLAICTPKNIFEACLKDSDCNQTENLMLSCVNGTCNCDTRTQAYSVVRRFNEKNSSFEGPEEKTCAPLVGQFCPDRFCVVGASCLRQWASQSTERTCQCTDGFAPNRNRTNCRKRGHSRSCTDKGDCAHNLVCLDKTCQCPVPNQQTYSQEQQACISSAGSHCNNDSTVCVPNAFCKPITKDSRNGHCECEEGSVENRDGKCIGGIGKKCSYSPECDQSIPLVCVDNVCSCKNQIQRFSPERKKCLSLVGALCDNHGISNCVENAECKTQANRNDLPPRCRCRAGYVENSLDYTCLPGPNTTITTPPFYSTTSRFTNPSVTTTTRPATVQTTTPSTIPTTSGAPDVQTTTTIMP